MKIWGRMPGPVDMRGEAYGIMTVAAEEILNLLEARAIGKGGASDSMLGAIQ